MAEIEREWNPAESVDYQVFTLEAEVNYLDTNRLIMNTIRNRIEKF